MPEPDDALAAEQELYAAAPEEFMARRGDLVAAARASGDAAGAKRIGALRKPTVAAAVVNRLVWDDPESVERLVELGARLRTAHEGLDAGAMRELTGERRALVGELTRAALRRAGQRDPTAALRDDVSGSFDAAVADPDIAARLGRLTKAAKWSGFGVAPGGAPALTVLRGGRSDRSARPSTPVPSEPPGPPAPAVPAAAQRKRQRVRDRAAAAFTEAQDRLAAAEQAERDGVAEVGTLTARLAELQAELESAKRDVDAARRQVRGARGRRREARSALDRAERQLADDS